MYVRAIVCVDAWCGCVRIMGWVQHVSHCCPRRGARARTHTHPHAYTHIHTRTRVQAKASVGAAAKPKKASKAKMNRELMMRVHKLGVVHAPRNASANE